MLQRRCYLLIKILIKISAADAHIFVWGHSLGSGIAAKLGQVVTDSGRDLPDGFILESPFSSLADEIESFRASRLLPFDVSAQVWMALRQGGQLSEKNRRKCYPAHFCQN
jgi:alpha-beta hydrolase superfamily lysophospholipase